MTIRVSHDSIRRPSPVRSDIHGYCVSDAECPWCGTEVLEEEPVVLRGQALETRDEGTDNERKVVDLSAAEWVCQGCAFPALYGDNDE